MEFITSNLLRVIPAAVVILFFIVGQLTGWPPASKIMDLGLVAFGLSFFIPTKKVGEKRPRPTKASGKKRGSGKTVAAVVAVILVLTISILAPTPGEEVAVPDIERTQTTALESGPGGGEEVVEFTIPPMFFAVLVGVLLSWVSSYVVRARVHFSDPPAYATRDRQGRQVYVDFSFTWQIENISRWLLVAMTRTDIASRLTTEIHSAMALAMSYSCEDADRLRRRIALLATKTVNSSVVSRYGVTCQVTVEHFRLEESIQQQVDEAMTQLLTERELGRGDAQYLKNLLGWPENVVFDLNNPAVVTIIEAKLRAEALSNLGTNIGEAIARTLRGIREGGEAG